MSGGCGKRNHPRANPSRARGWKEKVACSARIHSSLRSPYTLLSQQTRRKKTNRIVIRVWFTIYSVWRGAAPPDNENGRTAVRGWVMHVCEHHRASLLSTTGIKVAAPKILSTPPIHNQSKSSSLYINLHDCAHVCVYVRAYSELRIYRMEMFILLFPITPDFDHRSSKIKHYFSRWKNYY